VGTKVVTGLLLLVLLLTAFPSGVSAQTVKAFVDRDTIHLGETVRFTIRWAGPNPGTSVNLGVLKKDFDILGTRQSNQIKIINGRTKIISEWVTKLRPKHTGEVEIPSIQVGPHQTLPITLTVLPHPQPGQPRDRFL
jgi:hypothetical protein